MSPQTWVLIICNIIRSKHIYALLTIYEKCKTRLQKLQEILTRRSEIGEALSPRKQPVETIYDSLCGVTLTRRRRKRKGRVRSPRERIYMKLQAHFVARDASVKSRRKDVQSSWRGAQKYARLIHQVMGNPRRRASLLRRILRVSTENEFTLRFIADRRPGRFENCWTFAFSSGEQSAKTLWARKRRNLQKRNLSISIGVRLAVAPRLSFVYRCVTLSATRSRYHCYLTSRRNWIVVLFIGPDARDEHILLPRVILKEASGG